jgi:hypothetical protein
VTRTRVLDAVTVFAVLLALAFLFVAPASSRLSARDRGATLPELEHLAAYGCLIEPVTVVDAQGRRAEGSRFRAVAWGEHLVAGAQTEHARDFSLTLGYGLTRAKTRRWCEPYLEEMDRRLDARDAEVQASRKKLRDARAAKVKVRGPER